MATDLFALPSVLEIDEAGSKLGETLSELDAFAIAVEHADDQEKGEFCRRPEFARLLVFADDTLHDVQTLRDYAQRLQASLLEMYRTKVLDAGEVDRA